MPKDPHAVLSRRERQIMDVLYKLGKATANDVIAGLGGDTHSSTVRTQLRVLEEKGHIRHEEVGLQFVYLPVRPRHVARQSALVHMIETFFDGSAEKMLSTLLGGGSRKLSGDELDRLSALIKKAKKENAP